jgi:hypothetical protein
LKEWDMQALKKEAPNTNKENADQLGTPPVIIIGMHRSGTSMLARALSELGVYMGRKRTRNEECRWTNAINYWIFSQASATWERPEGMDTLLNEPDLCHTISDYMEGITSGPACIRYLGLRRYMRYKSMFRITEPWGWKDPRNTFTLPLWLTLFPNARVVHIIRHGVDVAQSLRRRRIRAANAAAQRYWSRRNVYVNYPLAPKRRGFAHSARVADLDGGMALWEAYTARGKRLVKRLGGQAMELYYEDLLQDPVSHLKNVAAFCGLEATQKILENEAKKFDSTNAHAYRQNEMLVQYANNVKGRLQNFKYKA